MCLSFFHSKRPAHDTDKSVVWIQKDNSCSVAVCLFVFVFYPQLYKQFYCFSRLPLFFSKSNSNPVPFSFYNTSFANLSFKKYSSNHRPRPSVEETNAALRCCEARNVTYFISPQLLKRTLFCNTID